MILLGPAIPSVEGMEYLMGFAAPRLRSSQNLRGLSTNSRRCRVPRGVTSAAVD